MRDAFQLQGAAAQIYEEQKVPAIFAPLARATLDAFPLSPQDVVLDAACGTGILARTIREVVGPAVRISGADLNEAMISVARQLTDRTAAPIRWEAADIASMPFADGEFSVVMCQQGIQFFPDERLALQEMRRVLQKGGRLALTVWGGISPLFRALADALERHLDREAAERSLAPFTYANADRLPEILDDAGFDNVVVGNITVERVINDPVQNIPKEIMGNPIGPAVAARGDAVMNAIVEEVARDCVSFKRGNSLVVPQETYLVTARAV